MIILLLLASASARDSKEVKLSEKPISVSDAGSSKYVVVESETAPDNAVERIDRNKWVVNRGSAVSARSAENVLGKISTEYKVKENLEENKSKVQISFYSDVPQYEMENIASKYGEVKYADMNSVVVELKENVELIAEEDAVYRIEPLKQLTPFNNGTRRALLTDRYESINNITGKNAVVAEWDEGLIESNHTDFVGRVTAPDTCKHAGDSGSCTAMNHATHVAGTMGGKGAKNSAYIGQAPNATFISWEWLETATELYNETNFSVSNFSADVAQNSWGYTLCYNGDYDSMTQAFDRVVYGNRTFVNETITIVFSAGNDGTDGYNSTCGPGGTAKNVITVGSIDYDDLEVSSYSSLGPTDDGRIKPDVVAPGCGTYSSHQISSTFTGDTYGEMCGTSMAAPVVSGIVALIEEAYQKTYNVSLLPSTDKAILVHTATDLGNAGPDYSYGWGLVDIRRALKTVLNGSNMIVQGNITQDLTALHRSNLNYSFNVSTSISKLRVTLVWSDPPVGSSLFNSLDVWLTAPNGTSFYPWVLNKSNPSAAATKATTYLPLTDNNNVRQVEVTNPSTGQWNISVNGLYVDTSWPQQFSLIFYQPFDNASPNIDYAFPTSAQNTTSLSKIINTTITDDNEIINCTFQVENANYSTPFLSYSFNTSCNITAVYTGKGVKTVKIYAQDYYGNWNVDMIDILVANSAPAVNTSYLSGNISARENTTFTITANASDLNNDNLTYSWLLNSTSIASTLNLSYTFNFTQAGNYSLVLNISDSENSTAVFWNLTVNNTNRIPGVSGLNITPLTAYTYDNLTCNYTYSDPDSNAETGTTINWHRNNTLNVTFQNQTAIGSSYVLKWQNWTCEIIARDEQGGLYTLNTSLLVNNLVPNLTGLVNLTVNESDIVNISLNAADGDEDTLTFASNLSYFTANGRNFSWQTNYTVQGTYYVQFNASDGANTTTREMILTVKDVARINANSSNVTATIPVTVFINGTTNETALSDLNRVNITDALNNTLILFDWNFSKANITVAVDYTPGNGTIVVNNLDLSSQSLTKTVFINKSTSTFNYVCIVDAVVNSIGSLSSDCSRSNETKVACPGSSGSYSCTASGSYFAVSGLNHTAVKGITVSSSTDNPGGGGGGGGGGGSDDTVNVTAPVCAEDWICAGWGKCENNMQTRECFDINNCGTKKSEPLTVQKCASEIKTPENNSLTTHGVEITAGNSSEAPEKELFSPSIPLILFVSGTVVFIVFIFFVIFKKD